MSRFLWFSVYKFFALIFTINPRVQNIALKCYIHIQKQQTTPKKAFKQSTDIRFKTSVKCNRFYLIH